MVGDIYQGFAGMAKRTLATIEPFLAENAEASLNDWWRAMIDHMEDRPPPWETPAAIRGWQTSLLNSMIQRQVYFTSFIHMYLFYTTVFLQYCPFPFCEARSHRSVNNN